MSNEASTSRVVVAAGTALYDDPSQNSLSLVPEALATVVRALDSRGLTPAASSSQQEVEECAAELGVALTISQNPGFLLNPTGQALEEALAAAAHSAAVIVFYYTGHGVKPEAGQYRVVLRETHPAKPHTYVTAATLLDDLRPRESDGVQLRAEQPYVLAIFDCCQSGEANSQVLADALRETSAARLWVAATARSQESAIQGQFAQALAAALDEADVGTVMPYIPMSEVVRLIQNRMPHGMYQQHLAVVPPNAALTGDIEPFFPNPAFNPEVAETIGAGLQHWLTRVRGVDERADLGLYLTGREGRVKAAERLSAWMAADAGPGLAVVTGSPGSGKSTLLAIPVLVAGTHDTREVMTSVGATGEALVSVVADRLPLESSVAGIHAKGLTADRIAQRISHQLGVPARSARDLVTQVIDEDADVVPSVLVLDAVDEAAQPADLVRSLLEPLSQHQDIKVVLGTRRNVLTTIHDQHLLIDLDSPEFQDPDALTDYIAQLLTASREPETVTAYGDVDRQAVRPIAEALASRATAALPANQKAESFLMGRLLAIAVRSRAEPVDVTQPQWLQHLPASVGAAFDEDLRRRLGDELAPGLALLTALAWARGAGLPREGIWSAVAQAIGGCRVTDADVRKVLTRAGSYVVQGVGPGGRGVYRLFHELLAEHLRGEPTQELTPQEGAAEAWEQHQKQIESAITAALLQVGPRTTGGQTDWALAHPYLRTHLAEHARAAGIEPFRDLIQQPDFLAVADPSTVTPLMDVTDTVTGGVARVYRRARTQLADNPADNVAVLAEAANAMGLSWSPARIRPSYSTLFSRSRQDDSALSFWTGAREVTSLAFATATSGDPVLLVGDTDGGIQAWDPGRGTAIGPRVQAHTSGVKTIATGRDGGDTIVVTSSGYSEPRCALLDDSGTFTRGGVADDSVVEHGVLPGSLACVRDPASGELIATRCYADVGDDGTATVRLAWSGGERRVVTLPVETQDLMIEVALACIDGEVIVASWAETGTLRLWTLHGTSIGQRLRAEGRPLAQTLALCSTGPNALAATGDWTGVVRVWDAAAAETVRDERPVIDKMSVVPAQPSQLGVASHNSAGETCLQLLDPASGAETGVEWVLGSKYVDALVSGRSTGQQFLCAYVCDDFLLHVASIENGVRILAVPARYNLVAVASAEDDPAVIALGSTFNESATIVVDAESGEVLGAIGAESDRPAALAVVLTSDAVLVAQARVAVCVVYRVGQAVPVAVVPVGVVPVSSLLFHQSETLLLAIGRENGTIEVDSLARTPDEQLRSEARWSTTVSGDRAISCMAVGRGPAGRVLLAGTEGGTIAVFSLSTGAPVANALRRRGSIRSVGMTEDGEILIHDDDGLTGIRILWAGI